MLWAIERVIIDPDQVNQDSEFHNREVYYLFSVAGTRGNRHIKLCVEYADDVSTYDDAGQVITAYVTHSIKSSEVLKWRK